MSAPIFDALFIESDEETKTRVLDALTAATDRRAREEESSFDRAFRTVFGIKGDPA